MSEFISDKYQKYIEAFGMSKDELLAFLINYHDSYALNDYLDADYLNFDFDSEEYLSRLVDFFKKNGVGKEQAKRILISTPLILSCKDPEGDLSLIYKGDSIEGIAIYDAEGHYHLYRKKGNTLRSIIQTTSFLEDLPVDENNRLTLSDKRYEKRFYAKNDCK